MCVILQSSLNGLEHRFEAFDFFLVTWKPHFNNTQEAKAIKQNQGIAIAYCVTIFSLNKVQSHSKNAVI